MQSGLCGRRDGGQSRCAPDMVQPLCREVIDRELKPKCNRRPHLPSEFAMSFANLLGGDQGGEGGSFVSRTPD